MVGNFVSKAVAVALLGASSTSAFMGASLKGRLTPRQLPASPTNVTTITSPTGVKIRYKEPGKAGVCETTPGVNSYCEHLRIPRRAS